MVSISVGVLAIFTSEVGIVVAANPGCYPGILCGQSNVGLFPLLRGIGIGGTFLFSGSLLLYAIALMRARFLKSWIAPSLLLSLLALPTAIVITEAADEIPGFFKVDPITIAPGLLWAIAWFVLGMFLLLRATAYQRQLSIAPLA